jgi:superfamily II DNA or RNA helicase
MTQTTKQLRPYQVRLVTDFCRASEDVLVEQPTGSGKTVQIVTLVAMQLGRRFSHAVISAPQEQIEQGFVKRDYQVIAFPGREGVAVPSIQVPKALIKGARESRLGSVKRVIHYLHQPGPLDHAFACTHATLNRLTPDDLPEDLSGKALFIDEAHHASADGLSEIITLWRERGGQLFFFTATPYRGDGRPVRLDGMRAFRRSLAEHMAERFAPRHLESEVVALGQPGDAITAGQFTGEEAPPSSYFEGLVAAICRRWREDDKPKAIVRVPPMQGGRSATLVSRLMQALSAQGARVLDATGTSPADKQRFLTTLKAEQTRTHATSAFDVMVGIQRVLEGTDWPVCSAVYCVGMPGSLNTVVQLLGRAMRLKGEDYPVAQRDRARLVFFVPCGGGAALADLSINHSRHALLTCCFLADHEVGQEWIVLREVRRGIKDALGDRVENPATADVENEADEPLDPEVRAEVELAMAAAREQIISSGGEPTVGEVVRLATKARPDLPEAALHRVAAEVLAAEATPTGAAVREAIGQEVARRLRIDPMVKKAMAEAFAVVLDEFRAVTLKDSAVLESVRRQVHGVTGGQMRQFAQRLRDAAPRPLTEKQILVWADAHHKRTGDWPKVKSGAVAEAPHETWSGINAALERGLRGLAGKQSLAKLLGDHRGVRNQTDLEPLTIEQILMWADAHFQRTGKWPTRGSGSVPNSDETWSGLDGALKQGLRMLPGNSSLARLLFKHRGVRNIKDLPALSIDKILAWADAHHERTGRWPTHKSGPIVEAPGEKWTNVNQALAGGSRGLPAGSSLAQLLAENRGVRNVKGLPPFSEGQLLAWADAYHERTGQWPRHDSGSIPEAPGETWGAVDKAMGNARRGFKVKTSLARFLAEHRGVRNPRALSLLSIEQILLWADAHHERTDQWPTAKSGQVAGASDEVWANVDQALAIGLRGLPGGSSLARLLAGHRGVKNRKSLPQLTVDRILAWADAHFERTGHWPRSKSGPVADAPGETWANLNQALAKGLRGLASGSSLARLLAEYRGVRNIQDLPPLPEERILVWAEAHYGRSGQWPKRDSGGIEEAPGENWMGVDNALRLGLRALPGGSSLARLIQEHLGTTTR